MSIIPGVNLVHSFDKAVHKKMALTANTPQSVSEINLNRAWLIVENLSSNNVTVCLGDKQPTIGEGLVLQGNGSVLELNSSNLFVGKIAVISDKAAELRILECSFN